MNCSPLSKTIWLYRHGSARNDNPEIDAGLDAEGKIEATKAAQYILQNSSVGNMVVLCSHLSRGIEAAQIMGGAFEREHRTTSAIALSHITSSDQNVLGEFLNIILAMSSIPFSGSEISGMECQTLVVVGHRQNMLLENLRIQLNFSDEIFRLTGKRIDASDLDSLTTNQELESALEGYDIDMFEESRLTGFQIDTWQNCINNAKCIADVSFSSKDERPYLTPNGVLYRKMGGPP